MPAVYTFTRSHAEILNSLIQVFSMAKGTMKEQWATEAEIQVEPVGWEALWKLSKSFCKKFEVGYPCIAIISVDSVNFEELKAYVDVLSVQHESMRLPALVNDVPLIELWPTLKQNEKSVNVECTAKFIDLLRFFYHNLWMPWDELDNKVLLPKNIEDRMKLWVELHDGTIPEPVAKSIITQRNSAIYAYEKLKELDSSLCDECIIADGDDSFLPPNYLSQYAVMNAHLESLIPKWSLYENPLIREHYLEPVLKKWEQNKRKRNVVALWKGGNVCEFSKISEFLASKLSKDLNLMIMASAEEGLLQDPEEVVFCSSDHEVPEIPLSKISLYSFNGSALKASEMRSWLLFLRKDCRIQDLSLSCVLVSTVIVMQDGQLLIKNCKFLNESQTQQTSLDGEFYLQSYISQAIVSMSQAKIIIEDCSIENFFTGLVVCEGTQVELRNCVIRRCGVGIHMYPGSQVKLYGTCISECHEKSIRYELDANTESGRAGFDGLEVDSNCKIGAGNLQQEVLVVKHVNLPNEAF